MQGELSVADSVAASIALRCYLSAEKALARALADCEQAASELHACELPSGDYVVEHDFKTWILEVGETGGIDILCATRL